MLHYSKSAGYAIHALSCIGSEHKPSLVREIADCTGLQRPYLAKIINQLAHHRLITAKRGVRGGILLTRPPERITLFQIVQAIDRDEPTQQCLFGLPKCPAHRRCPAHKPWKKMRKKMEALLRSTRLSAVMAASSRNGNGHPVRKSA